MTAGSRGVLVTSVKRQVRGTDSDAERGEPELGVVGEAGNLGQLGTRLRRSLLIGGGWCYARFWSAAARSYGDEALAGSRSVAWMGRKRRLRVLTLPIERRIQQFAVGLARVRSALAVPRFAETR